MVYNIPNQQNVVANMSTDVKADFIRKVYGIFFISLLVTVGVGFVASQFMQTMLGILPIVGIVGMIVGFGMAFTQRMPVVNFLLFALYSCLQGAFLGPYLTYLSAQYPGLPAEAGWLTISVFGALTVFVFASKKDFSFIGGFLGIAMIGLIVAGLVMFFVHAAWLSVIYSIVGVLIFAGYILYDTSQIMLKLQPGEEVTGAIDLYLDFVGLFWFILNLLRSRRD